MKLAVDQRLGKVGAGRAAIVAPERLRWSLCQRVRANEPYPQSVRQQRMPTACHISNS